MLNKTELIENELNLKLPFDYKKFLLNLDKTTFKGEIFCRIHRDGYRSDGHVDTFMTVDNFLDNNTNSSRRHIDETAEHFEIPEDYVEAKYLYHIGVGSSGTVCMSLGGQHYGKVYSCDNGDFGVIFQADNINLFLDSLIDYNKLNCTANELNQAVRDKNLQLLTHLIEEKDGRKLINLYSYVEIDLFDLAYRAQQKDILRYLMSIGYDGRNRVEYYNLKSYLS